MAGEGLLGQDGRAAHQQGRQQCGQARGHGGTGLAGRDAGTLPPPSPGPAVLHPAPAPGFHGNYSPAPDVAGVCKFM